MDTNDNQKEQVIFTVKDGGKSKKNRQRTSTGLDQNIAGSICYFAGFITGIIFLMMEKENRFVRFHAMQSTIVFTSLLMLSIAFTAIPFIGWLLGLLLMPISFVLWIYLMWKAYQNEWIRLPLVGDFAEDQLYKNN